MITFKIEKEAGYVFGGLSPEEYNSYEKRLRELEKMHPKSIYGHEDLVSDATLSVSKGLHTFTGTEVPVVTLSISNRYKLHKDDIKSIGNGKGFIKGSATYLALNVLETEALINQLTLYLNSIKRDKEAYGDREDIGDH